MSDLKKSRLSAIFSFIIAFFALFASVYSLISDEIYENAIQSGVFNGILLPGTFSQDIITVPVSISLLILCTIYLKKRNVRVFIALLGLTAYLFYAYGLFTISGSFTSLYLVYMVIFGFSIYSLIYGLLSLRTDDQAGSVKFPFKLGKVISIFLLFIVLMFGFIWLFILIPEVEANHRPETYAVFVLDLCIVLPAVAINAFLLLRNRPVALYMAGVSLVFIFTLIFSVLLGESLAPHFKIPVNPGMIIACAAVTLASLILGILYFRAISGIEKTGDLSRQ
jgi:hypothetical protein